MKSIARILGVTIALFSLTCVCAFAADPDSDEVIDKGRRGSFSGRSFTAPRVQQPRPQFRAPAQRIVAPPRQQSIRTGSLSTQPARVNQATQARRQQQSGQTRQQQTYSSSASQRSSRTDQTTGRVTNNPSGQQPRKPDNGYRPGIFNSPTYGQPYSWSADQRRQNNQPSSASTPSTARPSGRSDAIGNTRYVDPTPFPGVSVQPQVPDNHGALSPAAAQRSNPVRSTIGNNFIVSGTQPQFRQSGTVSRPSGIDDQPMVPDGLLPPPPGPSFRERLRREARNPERVREEMELTTISSTVGSIGGPAGALIGLGPSLPGTIARVATANNLTEALDEMVPFGLTAASALVPARMERALTAFSAAPTILSYDDNQRRLDAARNNQQGKQSEAMTPMKVPAKW